MFSEQNRLLKLPDFLSGICKNTKIDGLGQCSEDKPLSSYNNKNTPEIISYVTIQRYYVVAAPSKSSPRRKCLLSPKGASPRIVSKSSWFNISFSSNFWASCQENEIALDDETEIETPADWYLAANENHAWDALSKYFILSNVVYLFLKLRNGKIHPELLQFILTCIWFFIFDEVWMVTILTIVKYFFVIFRKPVQKCVEAPSPTDSRFFSFLWIISSVKS